MPPSFLPFCTLLGALLFSLFPPVPPALSSSSLLNSWPRRRKDPYPTIALSPYNLPFPSVFALTTLSPSFSPATPLRLS
jgi:hypothetical protein